jgi:hypothetical protein
MRGLHHERRLRDERRIGEIAYNLGFPLDQDGAITVPDFSVSDRPHRLT